MTNALERLVEQLRRLPGIGSKSARRLAYHLVEMPKEEVDRLVETIVEAKGATRHCSICFNLSAQDPCEFCSNPNRDQTTIMVVETSRDVIAIERSGDYKGLYHVLEGALSPMEGIGADDIRVKELIARLRDGVVQEVILATDPDVEGEATALYLARLLSPSGIKVTRIARGVPVGGDIEYADELTLGGAVVNRQEWKDNMGALLASPIISAVVSVAVAYIAFKVAFFTLKRVFMNAVTGIFDVFSMCSYPQYSYGYWFGRYGL